jgi:type VI secretion system protein ImpF
MKPGVGQHLAPSTLLDRLRDDDPRQASEGQVRTQHDLAGYRRAVALDLESLLNTRAVALDADMRKSYPLAGRSLLSFGITDLTSLSLRNPSDRARLATSIQEAIEIHEPRLDQVRVELDLEQDSTRALRFQVDALLRVHLGRPSVRFDALLQLASSTYQIRS